MNHWITSAERALIPLTVCGVFAIARKCLPSPAPVTDQARCSLSELDRRFTVTQWIVGGVMVVVGIMLAWVVHVSLVFLNHYFAGLEGNAAIVLYPQSAIWWFLPGFAALCLSWEITLRLWSRLGQKSEASLYEFWSAAKVGFDASKILRWMAVLIVLPIGIFTVLAIPEHTVLLNHEIAARRYAGKRLDVFPYSDAKQMTIVEGFRNRDGSLVYRAAVVLDFADGRRWSSAEIGDFKPTVDMSLLEFLEEKTGLQPRFKVAESDSP